MPRSKRQPKANKRDDFRGQPNIIISPMAAVAKATPHRAF